jgi:protein phosphatase
MDDEESGSGDTQPAGQRSSSAGRSHTLKLLSSGQARGLRSLADAAKITANPGVCADVAGQTDVGRVRQTNQDQFLIASLERSLLIEGSSFPAQAGTRLTDTPQARLMIVADGIGGHGGGEVASAVAIDAMARYAFAAMPWVHERSERSQRELLEGLQAALRGAQARVRRVARRKSLSENMGTTFTMAYVTWPCCYILHVGDSRAYLLRDGGLHRLTSDHTLAQQMVDHKAMSEEQAKRSRFSHVLVNAIGGSSDDLDIELHRLELQLDDQLLLCTDGLHGALDEPDMLRHITADGASVGQVVADLVASANEAGGRDNITAVLARF